MKEYGLVLVAVTELVVTVLMFFFAGNWADKHFNSGSRYVVAGAVVGCAIGFIRLVMRLRGAMGGTDDQP